MFGNQAVSCAVRVKGCHAKRAAPANRYRPVLLTFQLPGGETRFVAHEHRRRKLLQFFRIGQSCGVRVVLVEHLQIAALLVESALQAVLLHQWQDGDVVLHSEGELHVPRPAGLIKKPAGDRNDDQPHLLQFTQQVVLICSGQRCGGWIKAPSRGHTECDFNESRAFIFQTFCGTENADLSVIPSVDGNAFRRERGKRI